MSKKVVAPLSVRHSWRKAPTGKYAVSGVYECDDCEDHTANLPRYKFDVCPAKDRRKGKADRRRGRN